MRARNIKPGLYANELLAECSLAARLLFPGLWMMADREGRLEDRPKKIKAGVFPYDNFDTKPLLDELEYKGFIVRYEVQGGKYIEIINFLKHQKPHHNEKESEIPPRDQLATKEASTCDQGSKHLQPRSKALAPDSLIPDSLIPDCLIPDSNSAFSAPKKESSDDAIPLPQKAPKAREDETLVEMYERKYHGKFGKPHPVIEIDSKREELENLLEKIAEHLGGRNYLEAIINAYLNKEQTRNGEKCDHSIFHFTTPNVWQYVAHGEGNIASDDVFDQNGKMKNLLEDL